MDWAQILVIILAVMLAIFLVLGIVLAVLLIRLTQQIREVTSSAQRTVNDVESAVGSIVKLTSPGLMMKLFMGQAKKLKRKKEEKGE